MINEFAQEIRVLTLYFKTLLEDVIDYITIVEQLSDFKIPPKIRYLLAGQNCINVDTKGNLRIIECNIYQTGLVCRFRIEQLMPLEPAYKAIPIPFYNHQTDKYFEINMGMDIINWAGDQLLDQAQCVIKTTCLLYTSPSPRDRQKSRMPSSA